MPASIWLRPTTQKAAELQRIIDRLAKAHGTVAFRPHLTVCGVPGDLDVLAAASAYVKECGLLPLQVAKVAVTGAVITPLRAVFIEVENTPQLQEFRERLREICGGRPLIPPHISLLYTLDRDSQEPRTDFDAARLAAIAADCAAAIADTHFTLGRPVANSASSAQPDIGSWRVIRRL
jgi:2'-5' RNA ligase